LVTTSRLYRFQKIAELIRTKDHLTISGLAKIKEIKEGMNKGR
jgi:hypothetical protein